MFTGIIQIIGKVKNNDSGRLRITTTDDFINELKIGSSVAVNGVCLTAVELDKDKILVEFDVIPETISKTNLGYLKPTDSVNMEYALKPSDHLDGHIVSGHVDVLEKVSGISLDENEDEGAHQHLFKIGLSEDYNQYVVAKGSITIDGVSLTIVETDDIFFTVAIVPYTWEHTIMNNYEIGTLVNLEFDIIAKYVERMI